MVALPAANPYLMAVAATGIVEGVHDNIEVGSPADGLVEKVFVQVWENVEKGQPLFRLDTRSFLLKWLLTRPTFKWQKSKHARLQDQHDSLDLYQRPQGPSAPTWSKPKKMMFWSPRKRCYLPKCDLCTPST